MTRVEITFDMEKINGYCYANSKVKSTGNLLNELKFLEKSQQLMIWNDCSAMVGHNHVLVTLSAIYEPEVYHKSRNYQKLCNHNTDPQAIFKKHQL